MNRKEENDGRIEAICSKMYTAWYLVDVYPVISAVYDVTWGLVVCVIHSIGTQEISLGMS